MNSFYQSRLLCYVLDDMRACCKTQNYGPIKGLIEEVQIMGNRMEAKLDDSKNYFEILDEIKILLKTRKRLRQEVKNLEGKIEK